MSTKLSCLNIWLVALVVKVSEKVTAFIKRRVITCGYVDFSVFGTGHRFPTFGERLGIHLLTFVR